MATTHLEHTGIEHTGTIVQQYSGDLMISKQRLRQDEVVEMVRLKRDGSGQNLGFSSRPLVLYALGGKRAPSRELLHERRNSHFQRQVTGRPVHGLSWSQGRPLASFRWTIHLWRLWRGSNPRQPH
jgi:hypothetical protein